MGTALDSVFGNLWNVQGTREDVQHASVDNGKIIIINQVEASDATGATIGLWLEFSLCLPGVFPPIREWFGKMARVVSGD